MRTLDALISCGPYEGALEESLKELKYGFRRELAKPLARELAVAFVRLPARPDLLTWIPLHAKDLQWRKFNHAQLLAEELSTIVRVPAKELLMKVQRDSLPDELEPDSAGS
jgi:predicted amidophosphoribosyltransferase